MASDRATLWRRNLKKTLDYAAWAYLPLGDWSTTRLYDLIGTDTVAERGRYINLGYWKGATCIDQACAAMAQLLAETIHLSRDDVVLDVGFGFGEQDILWMERFSPRRIVGINVVPSQVIAARQRLDQAATGDNIQLHFGSATELPFEAESFTAITALECGFHFDTRERFFREAYRALRPGGRIVLSDIIPMEKPQSWQQRWHYQQSWQAFQRTWASPAANAYPRAEYALKLKASGFDTVRVESIRNNVFPGYHAYCSTHPEYVKRFNPVIRLQHGTARALGAQVMYGAFDYVVGVATKL